MIVAVAFVSLQHYGFMLIEMVYWLHPTVRKLFGLSEQQANDSKALAANIGLYNGFLASGLVWGLWIDTPGVLIFFLSCMLIAGVYGGLTAKFSIIWIQGLPALVGLLLVLLHYFLL